MSEIQDQACSYYKQLEPIAKRFLFERPPRPSEVNGMPMVLFLGNHSSGKSSFINYLLGSSVQRTGIAPVDDGFTILMYDEDANEKDGAAVVTDPVLGWEELKNFGEELVGRLRLRTHRSEKLRNIALIDSPGMIDGGSSATDRGYDFSRVVRWFSERADVIMFLFDPDKPGTTGETLHVLREALDGLEFKVLLVFNKVDRFQTMRDFARAYGALCWNLARAYSPRKDLPHIYNTYLPVGEDLSDHRLPLEDFDKAREEVIAEILRAPRRRLDNVVSRLYRYSRRLKMHATVISQREIDDRSRRRRYTAWGLGAVLLAVLLIYGALNLLSDSLFSTVAAIGGTTVGVIAGLMGLFYLTKRVRDADELFEEAYAQQLTLKEETADLKVLWRSVETPVRRSFEAGDRFRSLGRGERRRLQRIIDVEVPKMRSVAEEAKRRQRESDAEVAEAESVAITEAVAASVAVSNGPSR